MGLYQTIKQNNIYITLNRNTFKDAYLYFDLSEAITHSEKIIFGISQTQPTIANFDDLLNFFAIKKIQSFSESLTAIKDETNRKIIRKLSDAATTVAKQYSIGDIIKYTNSKYESLFAKKQNDETELSKDTQAIFFPLVEFCIKYQNGIDESVFMFLAENHWFIYINYYDDLKKQFLASWELFNKVFMAENILTLIRSRCQELLAIAKSIGESAADDKIKNSINERIFNCIINIMNTSKERDTIAYGDCVRRIRRYFSEIKFDQQKLALFEEAHVRFDKKLNDWMDSNGSVFSHNIPSDIANQIFTSEAQWLTKLLMCTHSLKEGKCVSRFTFDPPKDTPLVDFVSHNIDTDEYFTYSRQQEIQILGSVGTAFVLQTFVNEQYLKDITDWIAIVLGTIADHCKLDPDDLFADLSAIIQSIQFVDAARHKQATGYGACLIYGACVLIITCIEKLLRLVYKFENNIVLSDELIQLKALLSNPIISNVLTEDLMKATGFYLSRYGYVGLNYRNRLAHLSDIKMDEISDTLPHTFFFLYMSVVNGIFIHYCTDSKKSVSERPSAY